MLEPEEPVSLILRLLELAPVIAAALLVLEV